MVPPERMARVNDLIKVAIQSGGVTAATAQSSGGAQSAASSANLGQSGSQASVLSFFF